MAKDTYTSSQTRSQTISLSTHITALLLFFFAFLFTLLVITLNVPFPVPTQLIDPAVNTTSVQPTKFDVSHRLWLFRVTQDHRGNQEFGFGIWGWCTWDNRVEVEDGVACVFHAFWKVPRDAPANAEVLGLELPSAIKNALSITGFLLIFLAWESFTTFLLLLLTILAPPLIQQPRHGPRLPPTYIEPIGRYMAWILRSWSRGIILVFFVLGSTLPVLVVVGIGVGGVLGGGFGVGANLVIVALCMVLIGQGLIWFGGLRYTDGSLDLY